MNKNNEAFCFTYLQTYLCVLTSANAIALERFQNEERHTAEFTNVVSYLY